MCNDKLNILDCGNLNINADTNRGDRGCVMPGLIVNIQENLVSKH